MGHKVPEKKPLNISIIIATRGRSGHLHNCLTSLAMQDYPGIIQVIIAIDGEDRQTKKVASNFRVKKLKIQVLELEKKGPANARNQAISASDGDILLFIDDDGVADPNWISACVNQLEKNPNMAVSGAIYWHHEVFKDALTNWLDDTNTQFLPTGGIHQFSFSGRHPGFHGSGHPVPVNPQREMMNPCLGLLNRKFFYTCNGGLFKKALGDLRFDLDFTDASWEDMDFSRRLIQKGVEICFIPQAVVYHRMSPTLEKLEKKMKISGKNYIIYAQKGPVHHLTGKIGPFHKILFKWDNGTKTGQTIMGKWLRGSKTAKDMKCTEFAQRAKSTKYQEYTVYPQIIRKISRIFIKKLMILTKLFPIFYTLLKRLLSFHLYGIFWEAALYKRDLTEGH